MKNDNNAARTIRVVIVDDTRTIRAMIRALLERSPRIKVVGEASDPYEARELIRELSPDVITLDVVMPRMDGLAFLERLMRLRPMPVVMVSTRTTEKSSEAIQALSLGVFDCFSLGALQKADHPGTNLAETVLLAADSNSRGPTKRQGARTNVPLSLDWNGRIVTIGSSTGGVSALMNVLSQYPADGPPTVIVQHMPASFLVSFAQRLDKHVAPRVVLAKHGARLSPGTVHLAPGGDGHVELSPLSRYELWIAPHDGTETYVPSVNVLMKSAIKYGKKVVGVMLTGMGSDGAESMKKMHEAGAHIIAQDSQSCVVDGMPKAVRNLGAASEVVRLSLIGSRIINQVSIQPRDPIT